MTKKYERHGRCTSPEYRTWARILERCRNPRHIEYPRYGGSGVQVCSRWTESFLTFLADMGERPSSAHSLDRFPVRSGNYEPTNCRWATATQQSRNRDYCREIEYAGATRCVSEWAEVVGLKAHTLAARLRRGWSVEEAMTTKTRKIQ